MADAPNGAVVSQSTTQVHPSNGAPPNGAKPSEAKPAEAPAADQLAQRESQLKAREEAIAKREAKYQAELKKNAADKNGLGAKLSRLSELEKREAERAREDQLANLNPKEFAQKKWGEKWYEMLTDTQVNGVPPANLIAAEMQKMRDDFTRLLAERDEKAAQASTQAQQREEQETRTMVAHNCARYYEANAKEYPVFERLGDARRVGEMLGQRIEAEFNRTGKLITEKEAADALEADVMSLLDSAVAHEKYKSKLQEKLKPASIAESSGVQGVQSSTRRTLSNHLTASTPGKAPPRTDAEREARAIEMYQAIRAKSQA